MWRYKIREMCFWIQYIQITTMAAIFIQFLFVSGNEGQNSLKTIDIS